MTKDQADELKRLIAAMSRDSITFQAEHLKRINKAIDSLTQQPAELTDDEIGAVKETCLEWGPLGWTVDVDKALRAVITAHKEKQVKV